MTADAPQALACEAMEDKESMKNLTSIKLTLSQSLTKAQEKISVLSKQLQELHAQARTKTPTTEKPVLENKTRDTKLKCY